MANLNPVTTVPWADHQLGIRERLETYAHGKDRPVAQVVREAIVEYLDRKGAPR